ncbi:MAG TPA: class II fructose-1,6-bisphosphate aldolase [Candidatus Brocadiia bacterium]|nr:class II fructose-1,6-bisphosphate aldolase [Candidatus Brocadiia bacterium]
MPLVTTFDMLKKAQKGRYAVGAFNANSMEIIQAIIQAAEAERAPVILQASQGAIKYAGLNMIVAMVKEAADAATVPVALHLDHGTDLIQNIQCLRAGFTSLMYDGSKLPFEQNVANTKVIVEMAHACNLAVEAEIGQIGKCDDSDEPGVSIEKAKATMAVPEEAAEFIRQTKADFLAAAVGTIHGCRTPFAKLDLPRIQKIQKLTDCPLVLHGASGCTDEEIRKGISAGVCKINIDTLIRMAFVGKMREVLESKPNEIDPRNVLGPCREAAMAVVRDRIRAFGCAGKA